MSFSRAVVWLDHESAEVLEVPETEAKEAQKHHLKAHHHNTRQHASEVRTQHEFFASVCDALGGAAQVLILGSHKTLADLRHYVSKHRPAAGKQIVGWETAERLTEGQLLATGRRHFDELDRRAALPAPV
jgi:hypothetical protein